MFLPSQARQFAFKQVRKEKSCFPVIKFRSIKTAFRFLLVDISFLFIEQKLITAT